MDSSVLSGFGMLILLAAIFVGIFFATGANEIMVPKEPSYFSVSPTTGKLVKGVQTSYTRSDFMQNTTKEITISTGALLYGILRSSNASVVSANGRWIVCLHLNGNALSIDNSFAALFEVKGDNKFDLVQNFKIAESTAYGNSNHLVRLSNGNIMASYKAGDDLRLAEVIIDETSKTMRFDERYTNTLAAQTHPNFILSRDEEHFFVSTLLGTTFTVYKFTSDCRTLVKTLAYSYPSGFEATVSVFAHPMAILNDTQLVHVSHSGTSSNRYITYLVINTDLTVDQELTPLILGMLEHNTITYQVIVPEDNIISFSVDSTADPSQGRRTTKIDLSNRPKNLNFNEVDWYTICPKFKIRTVDNYTKLSDGIYSVYNARAEIATDSNDEHASVSCIDFKPKIPRIISAEYRRGVEIMLTSCVFEDILYRVYLTFPHPVSEESVTTHDDQHVGYVIESTHIKDDKYVTLNSNVGREIVGSKTGSRSISVNTNGTTYVPKGDLITGMPYYVDEDGSATIYEYAASKEYQTYPKPLTNLGVAVSSTKILKTQSRKRVVS